MDFPRNLKREMELLVSSERTGHMSTWGLRDLTAHARDGVVEVRAGREPGDVRVTYVCDDGRRVSVEGMLGECVAMLLRHARRAPPIVEVE